MVSYFASFSWYPISQTSDIKKHEEPIYEHRKGIIYLWTPLFTLVFFLLPFWPVDFVIGAVLSRTCPKRDIFVLRYVLSVLKFTYPTLFLGWQTFTGALLLLVTGKLGLVEISSFPGSAAMSWLPGSLLFLGNIYTGSKTLSILPIPFFFMLQNVSEVVFLIIVRFTQRERSSWVKIFSETVMLMSAVALILQNQQIEPNGFMWAFTHLLCVGAYRAFQRKSKSANLSDLEQHFINCIVSMLLLASAAHPTGDLFGAFDFPFLMSYKFYSGCFASAVLGFCLLVSSVQLKSRFSVMHCAVWVFLAKILASSLSVFIFSVELRALTLCSILANHAGEALLIYSDRSQER